MYRTNRRRRRLFQRLLLLFVTLAVMKFYRSSQSLATRQEIFGSIMDNKYSRTIKIFYHKTLQPPGVILRPKGGIGNQLFQYACSYVLARDLEWPLYFEHAPTPITRQSSRRGFRPTQREFALDHFQIPLDNIINDSTNYSVELQHLDDRQFLERTFLRRNDSDKQFVYLNGISFCQSIEYWRDYQEEIRAMFQPHEWAVNKRKLGPMINKIESSGESVAVHVRRGDFTSTEGYHVPLSYQRRAIRKMIKLLDERGITKPVFFVFSDDIRFAKEKLKDFGESFEMVFVSQEIRDSTSIEELYLMTLCKHFILPNSSFSWWAAYLMKNLEKIVIASALNPTFFHTNNDTKKNLLMQEVYGKIYYPKEWIVINPFTGGL